jgi:putative membrane protein
LACIATLPVLTSFNARADTADQDKDFLAKAAQSDVNEIKLSQLAEQKASNPQVKMFARKMVTDHKALEMKMKPYAMAWRITTATDLDDDHKAEYQKLNGLTGNDFDKEYMDAMATDHHKALDAFSKEVDSTDNPKFKIAVEKGKAVVASHTTMADDLKGKL